MEFIENYLKQKSITDDVVDQLGNHEFTIPDDPLHSGDITSELMFSANPIETSTGSWTKIFAKGYYMYPDRHTSASFEITNNTTKYIIKALNHFQKNIVDYAAELAKNDEKTALSEARSEIEELSQLVDKEIKNE